jgi:malonyl-CoA/methylmalonyl-CoA synthetase
VSDLFPPLSEPSGRPALRFPDRTLTHAELARAAGAVAERVAGLERVAVWATPDSATAVAVIGVLAAGRVAIPVNPKAGPVELAHILDDGDPGLLLHAPGAELPAAALERPRAAVDLDAADALPGTHPGGDAPALIVYTSGTTGPPKGAVLPRRALASNLDALAAAWEWTAADEVAHALPLFHVHGLVLGTLGPVRLGGAARHLGRFSPRAAADALREGATMLFGVPTMYGRIVGEAQSDPAIAEGLARARLLVSGSAALPARHHEAIERLCGQRIVERYGMSETLMNTAVRASGDRRPGTVGPPLDGVELRLVGDDGGELDPADPEAIGEIHVKGPNLLLGYRNRPDATAAAFDGPWFRTGDLATRGADGYVRIVGRRATDLIKSGGFKIGAGEIEGALLEHPAVAEAAVTGAPDADLGEVVVAWVVARAGEAVSEAELADHVAAQLTPHKRPRVVRFLDELPRNALGKVQKRRLPAG